MDPFFNLRIIIMLKKLFRENKFTICLMLSLWLVSIYFLIDLPQGALVLYFNDHKSAFFDLFFTWLTYFAEFISCVIFCLIVLFIDWKKGVYLSICLILNSLFVQFLKRIIFPEYHRPYHYFKEILKGTEGIDLHSSFSFPSGHTMSGFTLFFVLSLFVKNQLAKISLIFLGVLVALSRVYLAQHFLRDIVVASILAVFLSVLYLTVYNKKFTIL